jgi:hypothetical protein
VPSVETPIPSGVPPAASGSCAPASSHGEEHLPACPQRRAPHESRTTGETSQGCRVPSGGQETGVNSLEGVLRGGRCAKHGHRSCPCGVSRAWHRPHDGGWPPGKLHSVRLLKPGQAVSGRGPSNHMLSEVLRAGRASTAGRSPLSTPDSILMCYPKSSKRPSRGVAQLLEGIFQYETFGLFLSRHSGQPPASVWHTYAMIVRRGPVA